jgi:uncharacterized membrane protein
MSAATKAAGRHSALLRVVLGAAIGSVVGVLFGIGVPWQAAILLGWDAAAITFLTWVWATIWHLDAASTRRVASREDPSARIAHLIIVVAGVACLAAVGLVLVRAAEARGAEKAALVAIAVASVAFSWAALHTVFLLRYARLYYGVASGGIDFNEDADPDYRDFAYVSFTIGLTFQVSDTNISDKRIRRTALRHALLAFLFGAVIIGLTINVVATLLR